MSKKENRGTNPLIHETPGETLAALTAYSAHYAESLESDPEKHGALLAFQPIVEALQHLRLDQNYDQCHTQQ